MWYAWLVKGLIALFACFGHSGKTGLNCHCFMYCDVVSPPNAEQPEPHIPNDDGHFDEEQSDG